jgi:uncharacterized cupredoxin-like copper-binding protein
MKTHRAIALAMAALMLAVAACSSPATPSPTTITVKLTDYKINMSAYTAPAGEVTFNVANDGTMIHEFVVLKTDTLAKDLPIVGTTVDEAAFNALGEVPEKNAGDAGTVTLTLTAGHYAIICNIDGHVTLGMVTDLTVN